MGSSNSCCQERSAGGVCCDNVNGIRLCEVQPKKPRGFVRENLPAGFSHHETGRSTTHNDNRLTSRTSSSDHYHPTISQRGMGMVGIRTSEHVQQSWIKVPNPLPGWTSDEQQVFIDIVKEFPRASHDSTQLELALVQGMRKLPHKKEHEFIECFEHIQESRVAYFDRADGPTHKHHRKPSRRASS